MQATPSYRRSRNLLLTPLASVQGVGPKTFDKFKKMGVENISDALYTLPHRYEDRRTIRRISALRSGEREIFTGEIRVSTETQTSRSRRRLWEVIVDDGSGTISLKWFHFRKPWMQKQYVVGRRLFISGEVKRYGAQREVHHPDVEFLAPGQDIEEFMAAEPYEFGRLVPVYPLTEGLHQKSARKIFHGIIKQYAPMAVSPLPEEIRQRHELLPLPEALAQSHWPSNDAFDLNLIKNARDSLVFDEFFYLELGLALKHRGVALEEGIPFKVEHRYTKPLLDMLPFRLTNAQRRVLGEIKHDLMRNQPMNRLLQGDVGSGKTIVALMAALVAIENDYQVAVVAPTEILAEQHFLQFYRWLEALGLKAALLTGSQKKSERTPVLEAIAAGDVDLVVGTHAVLQEGVDFCRLGLGIIDEQHRFGVEQRGVLRRKGEHPHILVMTATPIPRSLSLTVFGDLSLSVIDELPPGRKPVRTHAVAEAKRSQVYKKLREELSKGRQAYIVYPLVEESEKSDLQAASEASTQLQEEIFSEFSIGLLHGRMKPPEKDAVMQAFYSGELQILVATTVIEVGIDVPNASVMVVEHAERFGLAQLHQLRGRVGRGGEESYCFLFRSPQCSEDGFRRLRVMQETNDGFRIAEADLEIRGPGDFLGTRQAGIPDFRIANILKDGRILEQARQEAFQVAEREDFFTNPELSELREALQDRWGSRLEFATIG
ncbi:MAG: DNA helicase RecG [Desulfuromonas sp.]|nr:MAG: DNA helicase RecG [Desulfuromonas sp.]